MDPLDLESLLAAMGVESVMRGAPTLHKYQLQAAADLPRDIRRRMLRFLATDAFAAAGDLPKFDYTDVLNLVSNPDTTAQDRALMATVPDRDLAMDLGIEANRIRTWANQALPRGAPDNSGYVDEPDSSAVSDFRRMWEVATDPMVVMRDLAAGCLSDDQVATVSLLYPALYGEMRQAASDARAQTAGRRGKNWQPSAAKTQQLGALLQQDATDPRLAAAVQAIYAKQPDQPPPPARHGGASDPTQGLTPGERAAAGS